jgi:cellulose biosynthesis protein BcsQ
LLVEWLNYLGKKVQLVDTDPIQSSQDWINNCKEQGREVSQNSADYQIIDTAGSSGSALSWLKQAELIIVPFQPHYVDLKVTIDWFDSLKKDWQEKIIFIPNRWQNTKEQREGLAQLKEIIREEEVGKITEPLNNRPALYGSLLNGSKNNFFVEKKVPQEAQALMKFIEQQIHASN